MDIRITISGKRYYASRLAFLWMKGYLPEHDVDHKNRRPSDNRWKNLRHVTHQCNNRNQSIRKDNKSGITGVCLDKTGNKWNSYIKINMKMKYLGCFDSKEKAAMARWNAEVKYDFPNCNTTSSAYQFLQRHQ
jgi:hypothetical protein